MPEYIQIIASRIADTVLLKGQRHLSQETSNLAAFHQAESQVRIHAVHYQAPRINHFSLHRIAQLRYLRLHLATH